MLEELLRPVLHRPVHNGLARLQVLPVVVHHDVELPAEQLLQLLALRRTSQRIAAPFVHVEQNEFEVRNVGKTLRMAPCQYLLCNVSYAAYASPAGEPASRGPAIKVQRGAVALLASKRHYA